MFLSDTLTSESIEVMELFKLYQTTVLSFSGHLLFNVIIENKKVIATRPLSLKPFLCNILNNYLLHKTHTCAFIFQLVLCSAILGSKQTLLKLKTKVFSLLTFLVR